MNAEGRRALFYLVRGQAEGPQGSVVGIYGLQEAS